MPKECMGDIRQRYAVVHRKRQHLSSRPAAIAAVCAGCPTLRWAAALWRPASSELEQLRIAIIFVAESPCLEPSNECLKRQPRGQDPRQAARPHAGPDDLTMRVCTV